MEQFVSAYDGDSPDAQEKAQGINSSSVVVVNVHDNDSLEIIDATSLFFDYKKNNSTALFDRYYFRDINKVSVSNGIVIKEIQKTENPPCDHPANPTGWSFFDRNFLLKRFRESVETIS